MITDYQWRVLKDGFWTIVLGLFWTVLLFITVQLWQIAHALNILAGVP